MEKKSKFLFYHAIFTTICHPLKDEFIIFQGWIIGSPTWGLLNWTEIKMENKERGQTEAYYQKEIESIKCEIARLTNMLEQVLIFRNGKETFAQPPVNINFSPQHYTSCDHKHRSWTSSPPFNREHEWLVLKSAFLSRFYIIILHLKYQ